MQSERYNYVVNFDLRGVNFHYKNNLYKRSFSPIPGGVCE